jgi:thiamine-phosphate pyrophosphorylase
MTALRPLPRLHAVTDATVVALADFGVRAAAIAAAGSAVALHARHPEASAADLAALAGRLVALARPAEANVIVNRRADIAAAIHAQGVQLRHDDISPRDARRVLPAGWVGRSVHSAAEAMSARAEGADYVIVGPIFPTASHPGAPGGGIELVRGAGAAGIPVIAIGGIDAERALEVAAAGAWGVGVLSALWTSSDPAQTALTLLAAWTDAGN